MLKQKRERTKSTESLEATSKRPRTRSQDAKDATTVNIKETTTESDFTKYKISAAIEAKLKLKNITSLFDVQKSVFQPIYDGKNVMVSALTGSGKTLSFVLPLIQKCHDKGRLKHDAALMIVIAPTRELSMQISKEFSDLSSNELKYNVATIYGGVSLMDQSNNIFIIFSL